jgi:hypothetical protein
MGADFGGTRRLSPQQHLSKIPARCFLRRQRDRSRPALLAEAARAVRVGTVRTEQQHERDEHEREPATP